MTIQEVVNSARPVQVMFYDGEGMCPGIMWGDQIVCACCGGTFWVDDVIENAKTDKTEAIRMFPEWVNLSEEIQGDTSEHCDWEGTVLLEMEEC